MAALRFRGTIAGLGTTSGVRIVVGSWVESPYAAFADVMLAEPGGRRVLLAPTPQTAGFVSRTYSFDEVAVVPVQVTSDGHTTRVTAGELRVAYAVGARTPLGRLLRLVPAGLATSSAWSRVTDPVARVVLRGVRTRGSAGSGHTEVYGATDHHAILSATGSWRGGDLGGLAPLAPPPGFGFGSTPERPSVTTLVTTVATSA